MTSYINKFRPHIFIIEVSDVMGENSDVMGENSDVMGENSDVMEENHTWCGCAEPSFVIFPITILYCTYIQTHTCVYIYIYIYIYI